MTRPSSIRQRGITLMEVIIVMAVIALMFYAVLGGLNRITNADLRQDSMRVAATLRAGFNMATASGKHHRVVLDLKKQLFWIEMCEGKVKLTREGAEVVLDEDALAERKEMIAKAQEELKRGFLPGNVGPGTADVVPEIVGADTAEGAVNAAAALAGVRTGNATCGPPQQRDGEPDSRGEPKEIATGTGIKIRRVTVAHLEEPVVDDIVRVNFFPLGFAEKAVIEIVNEDNEQFSLMVHRMTGRVVFKSGEVDVEKFMNRDGAGDSERER